MLDLGWMDGMQRMGVRIWSIAGEEEEVVLSRNEGTGGRGKANLLHNQSGMAQANAS